MYHASGRVSQNCIKKLSNVLYRQSVLLMVLDQEVISPAKKKEKGVEKTINRQYM